MTVGWRMKPTIPSSRDGGRARGPALAAFGVTALSMPVASTSYPIRGALCRPTAARCSLADGSAALGVID
jgi:hypothetical protein